MTAAAGRANSGGSSIGAVLAQLRSEFPEVTISKIRFLESEGLVRPARTSSGYRQFAKADIERLRFVLAAQRDHYLPLKVIKEQLDAVDLAEHGTDPAAAQLSVVPRPDARPEPVDGARRRRLTREEFLDATGVGEGLLGELEQYGLVRPGAAGFYEQDAVPIARTAKELTGFGIEPRHLRAFRSSADREVALLEQIVAPVLRQRDPRARERAEEILDRLAALSVSLHAMLVKAGLRGVAKG
ncbi:MerR family transcriptional regulator [Allokutzneria sp. A3M-2-11 16]|uniref:transcriptional regulator FtsR n=1 Tax=Allokutzneria sp. A3M-2-11 16 TaxID=2962043 RepID=UPI0020B838A0|nr:MerR family transcriptional regulator [Allokutzneria sp. A3M-2-11 16]MCP3802139.1 MerR family transcriptional regulator [Allokutzneria sp. A3M-2-11 16]